MKITKKHYDTLESAIAESQKPDTPIWQSGRESKKTGDSSWQGTDTLPEALTLARKGWPDGLKRMAKDVKALTATPVLAMSQGLYFDVAGAYPMAAMAAAGEACCMVSLAPVADRVRPVIRLAVMASVSAVYRPDQIHNYGAALISIIDALESDNYRVELTAIFSFKAGDKEKALFTVTLKQAQESLDLDRLAFCLCHASFLRRFGFAIMEQNLAKETWGGTYGRPYLPEAADLDSDQIILSGPQGFKVDSHDLNTPQACFKALLAIVGEQLADRFKESPPLQFSAAA